jgi:hypothetical protein
MFDSSKLKFKDLGNSNWTVSLLLDAIPKHGPFSREELLFSLQKRCNHACIRPVVVRGAASGGGALYNLTLEACFSDEKEARSIETKNIFERSVENIINVIKSAGCAA